MTQNTVTVYTLPGCPHCDALKSWLKSSGMDFTEKLYADEVQVELIMKNIFCDPPIMEVDSQIYTPDELFKAETLNEEMLREALHEKAKE